MRLNDPLVTSFIYKEKEYTINLAFDVVLDAFDWLDRKDLRDYEKAEICLDLLLNEGIEGGEALELWNYIFENFIQFKEKKAVQYDLKGNPMPVMDDEDEKEYSDIEQDAEYIYSSFRQAYGINLFHEQGKMQWAEFKALLHGLPQNTIMKQIIQIRSWEPSKHDSDEHKKEMKKLQEFYALEEVD